MAVESPKKKHPGGRPTIYTKELAELICFRTATTSFGIKKLCATYDDLPNADTIYDWRHKYPEFSVQYAQAKLKQAEFMAEEIIGIADDATNDWMDTLSDEEKGIGWKLNGEHYARSRLRIDTRKWLASKLLPKTYGNHAEEAEKKSMSLIEQALEKIPTPPK